MKTIQRVLISALLIITCNILQAQDYKTGIGVRLGGLTSGLTVKGFVNQNSAIEGIMSFGMYDFILTGLYEKHNPIDNAEGLKWLYGGGVHVGFFRYGSHYYYFTDHGHVVYLYATEPGMTSTVGGLDFIIGLDYKFHNAPFNVGLDLKPFVDFFDGVQGYWDGALSFRFVF
jgi:hypothetical protein